MSNPIIGIDVGGVIIDKDRNDHTDTSLFGPNYLNAKAVDGAFTALGSLNRAAFKDRVWIVSKCGENIEKRTREWLEHHEFHAQTGIPKERLRFCRERRDKAPIATELWLTHFVDDKLEVLNYMEGIVRERILFRPYGSEITRNLSDRANGISLWMDWSSLSSWLQSSNFMPDLQVSIEALRYTVVGLADRIEPSDKDRATKLRVLFMAAANELAFLVEGELKHAEELGSHLIEYHEFNAYTLVKDLIECKRKAMAEHA